MGEELKEKLFNKKENGWKNLEETKKQENKSKKKLSVDSTMLLTIGATLGIIVLIGIIYFIFKTF